MEFFQSFSSLRHDLGSVLTQDQKMKLTYITLSTSAPFLLFPRVMTLWSCHVSPRLPFHFQLSWTCSYLVNFSHVLIRWQLVFLILISMTWTVPCVSTSKEIRNTFPFCFYRIVWVLLTHQIPTAPGGGCNSGLVPSLIFEEKQSFSSENQVSHDWSVFFFLTKQTSGKLGDLDLFKAELAATAFLL